MPKAIKPIFLTRKPYPIPKGLIYRHLQNNYSLAETKTGDLIGTMHAGATKFDPNGLYKKGDEDKIFHIYSLNIKPEKQNQGWGKYFINFAKAEGLKEGCEGRMSLVAYNEYISPHLFYWKQGFRSLDEKINKLMEFYIRKNRSFYFDALAMYMPVNEATKQDSFKNKILKRMRKLVKNGFKF